MKKVSILVPIYGVEKYIEQCARSLFEQTYEHIEYIFVNDCTPDRSIDILLSLIEEYPNRADQIHIINHENNKGVGAARQTALTMATGNYVMFADSDDFLPPNAVEALVKKTESSKADLIDGAYSEWSYGKVGQAQLPLDIASKKFLKLLISQNITVNRLWGRLYKRSLIVDHQIHFVEGVNYAEDLFWNTQYMFYANRDYIDEVVYYYRTDNIHSYTHNISEKNLWSYFQSSRLMAHFFASHDTKGTFHTAIDIAIANVYREAAKAHIPLKKVDRLLAYAPKSITIKIIIYLIKKRHPIKLINILYLAYRKLYNSFTILR